MKTPWKALCLLGAVNIHAMSGVWGSSTYYRTNEISASGNWTVADTWSSSPNTPRVAPTPALPGENDDVVFGNTSGFNISMQGSNRTIRDFTANQPGALLQPGGNNDDVVKFSARNFIVDSSFILRRGTADTFYDIEVRSNLTLNATLQLGSRGGASDVSSSSISNFAVAGITQINSGGRLDFSRLAGPPNTEGAVNLGALHMNGGTLNLTITSNESGANQTDGTPLTSTGHENRVLVNRLYSSPVPESGPDPGLDSVIRAGKDNTSGAVIIGGNIDGTYRGTIVDGAATRTVRLELGETNTATTELTNAGNTYSGSTTIKGGTLLLSGSGNLTNTSVVTIDGGTFITTSSSQLTRDVTLTTGKFVHSSPSNYAGTLTITSGTLGGTNWNGNLGGLVIGAGQFISPGNSIGTAVTTTQTWAEGGGYVLELQNATGVAGVDGWDLLQLTGALTLTATAGNPFQIQLVSLDGNGDPGLALNFNPNANYTWLIASAGDEIAGFSMDLFSINLTGFANPQNGTFSVMRGDFLGGSDSQLFLVYTTVIPEPSAGLLLGIGLGVVLWVRRQRKQALPAS